MNGISRRRLARYGAALINSGHPGSQVGRRLAAAMVAAGSSKDYRLLLEDIDYQLEISGKMSHAKVTSAHSLSPASRKQLLKILTKATGTKKVVLEENIDPAVIGGIRIETAIHSWDATASRLLKEMSRI
jgi:F0F1-type ATP synthase delta subunit